MVFTESHDGGWTWSKGVDSKFPNPNSAMDFIKLKSGNLMLVYNDHMYKRRKLTLALSTDKGETFPHRYLLMNGDAGMAYPYVIQGKDDRIHVVFTYNRIKIMHAVFEESEVLNSK